MKVGARSHRVKKAKRTLRVAAGVVRRKDRILVARRARGQSRAGYWEFPGGTIHRGESVRRCLQRELQEELGIDIATGRRLLAVTHEYADLRVRLQFLSARWTGGKMRLTVHDRVKWVTPVQLLKMKLSAADVPMALKLNRRRGSGRKK